MSSAPKYTGLEWYEWEGSVVDALIDHLAEAFKVDASMKQRQAFYAREIGWNPQRFAKWLKKSEEAKWFAINEFRYRELIKLLSEDGKLPGGWKPFIDLEARGLMSIFGHNKAHHHELVNHGVGNYVAYRYSFNSKCTTVLRGRLAISAERSGCFKVVEKFSTGEHGETWDRTGYIVGKAKGGYAIISRKNKTYEVEIVHLRSPMVNLDGNEDEFNNASGIVIDWQGSEMYVTAIFIKKVKKELELSQISELNPRNPKELDPRIKQKLEGQLMTVADGKYHEFLFPMTRYA